MALNGNKAQLEFPYEIKEADADMKEQFIRDFEGRRTIMLARRNIIIIHGDKELQHIKKLSSRSRKCSVKLSANILYSLLLRIMS